MELRACCDGKVPDVVGTPRPRQTQVREHETRRSPYFTSCIYPVMLNENQPQQSQWVIAAIKTSPAATFRPRPPLRILPLVAVVVEKPATSQTGRVPLTSSPSTSIRPEQRTTVPAVVAPHSDDKPFRPVGQKKVCVYEDRISFGSKRHGRLSERSGDIRKTSGTRRSIRHRPGQE